MNDNDVRERVLIKLSEMADCETVSDLIITYTELKHLLRDYKNALEICLRYRKELIENDN